MKNILTLVAMAAIVLAANSSYGQSRYSGRHTTTARQASYGKYHSGTIVQSDCSCGHCQPCCPKIIPSILNGIGRAIDCLFPCHRNCGSCNTGCASKGPSCGCGAKAPSCGCGVNHAIVGEPMLMPPKPSPDQASYRTRRTPTYKSSSVRRLPSRYQPTPVRKAPQTKSKKVTPKYRTVAHTTSTPAKKSTPKRSTGLNFQVPVNPLR